MEPEGISMAMLTIEVPEGVLSALRQSPREAERDAARKIDVVQVDLEELKGEIDLG
jgi:hypothetical protein